jgi:hypothetical protein
MDDEATETTTYTDDSQTFQDQDYATCDMTDAEQEDEEDLTFVSYDDDDDDDDMETTLYSDREEEHTVRDSVQGDHRLNHTSQALGMTLDHCKKNESSTYTNDDLLLLETPFVRMVESKLARVERKVEHFILQEELPRSQVHTSMRDDHKEEEEEPSVNDLAKRMHRMTQRKSSILFAVSDIRGNGKRAIGDPQNIIRHENAHHRDVFHCSSTTSASMMMHTRGDHTNCLEYMIAEKFVHTSNKRNRNIIEKEDPVMKENVAVASASTPTRKPSTATSLRSIRTLSPRHTPCCLQETSQLIPRSASVPCFCGNTDTASFQTSVTAPRRGRLFHFSKNRLLSSLNETILEVHDGSGFEVQCVDIQRLEI